MKDLYRRLGWRGRFYWTVKQRIFPLETLRRLFPPARKLVDLGCGNGLFALFLARLYPQMEIIGADIDVRKIEAARAMAATAGLANLSFIQADVSSLDIPKADFYLCVDLFYLLPFEVQEKIARAVTAAMEPGGTFLLKEMDTKPAWKHYWNLFQETLAVRLLGFTRGGRFYFRPAAETAAMLGQVGLEVRIVSLQDGYPYPHTAFIARKPEEFPGG